MNTYKNTFISGISIFMLIAIFSFLPAMVGFVILFSASLITAVYFVNQNYDINYKYWFSFISQLGGLLLIVASFVLMMVIIFNFLGQI